MTSSQKLTINTTLLKAKELFIENGLTEYADKVDLMIIQNSKKSSKGKANPTADRIAALIPVILKDNPNGLTCTQIAVKMNKIDSSLNATDRKVASAISKRVPQGTLKFFFLKGLKYYTLA